MNAQPESDNTASGAQRPPGGDDATRHLCAAAHVDDSFSESIITEYLAEPRRAVPPSPGVEPAAVLREALDARRRRVVRDLIATVLFVALVILTLPVSIVWILIGLAVVPFYSAANTLRADLKRVQSIFGPEVDAKLKLRMVGTAAVLIVTLLFIIYLTAGLSAIDFGGTETRYGEAESDSGAGWVVIVLIIALLGVLIEDKIHLHHLLRHRFSRFTWRVHNDSGPPSAEAPAPREKKIFADPGWYSARLTLIEDTSRDCNTTVHHDYKAFVGAGTMTRRWTVVSRLKPESDDTEPIPLKPSQIYAAVIDEVLRMRSTHGLSPGDRLATLDQHTELVAAAEELLHNRDHPMSMTILPDTGLPANNYVDPSIMQSLSDGSPEWVRPYLCFRVDSWDRQLVVSTYLHVGCDDDMLYLEWSSYQLNPIRKHFEVERMPLNFPHRALLSGLNAFLLFPVTFFSRLRTLGRALRDAAGRVPKTSLYDPAEAYGARRSIREIAADTDIWSYFEKLDSIRYLRLLEHRTLTAVLNVLRSHGWSDSELAEQRTTIMNSTVISGGNVSAGAIGGQDNTVSVGPVSSGAGPKKDTH